MATAAAAKNADAKAANAKNGPPKGYRKVDRSLGDPWDKETPLHVYVAEHRETNKGGVCKCVELDTGELVGVWLSAGLKELGNMVGRNVYIAPAGWAKTSSGQDMRLFDVYDGGPGTNPLNNR